MPFKIADWFGYDLADWSAPAIQARNNQQCPFIAATCTKKFNDGSINGVCSAHVGPPGNPPIIICPNRLYAGIYFVLQNVAETAFGPGHELISPEQFKKVKHDGLKVLALGKGRGGEIRLPTRGGRGAYFVDWILASISANGDLAEFAAVEVQAIDTTGTYRPQVLRLRQGQRTVGISKAGLNWENVNKRILPQLIYKGHVLRREALCKKGLFFICPSAVYDRIVTRLGGNLLTYANLQPGSLTFVHFNLGEPQAGLRSLNFGGQFSTTVDQVALAFTTPTNLPEVGVYEQAIRLVLSNL